MDWLEGSHLPACRGYLRSWKSAFDRKRSCCSAVGGVGFRNGVIVDNQPARQLAERGGSPPPPPPPRGCWMAGGVVGWWGSRVSQTELKICMGLWARPMRKLWSCCGGLVDVLAGSENAWSIKCSVGVNKLHKTYSWLEDCCSYPAVRKEKHWSRFDQKLAEYI